MEENVKQIIAFENKEIDEFMEYQRKRISELKEMLEQKNSGKDVDISDVLSSLRRSGVLDQNNNIVERYAGRAVSRP